MKAKEIIDRLLTLGEDKEVHLEYDNGMETDDIDIDLENNIIMIR